MMWSCWLHHAVTSSGRDENQHLQIPVHGPRPEKGDIGDEILPQVEEFKYLRVLFTSEGRMEREIDRRIGAASAVMWTLH